MFVEASVKSEIKLEDLNRDEEKPKPMASGNRQYSSHLTTMRFLCFKTASLVSNVSQVLLDLSVVCWTN